MQSDEEAASRCEAALRSAMRHVYRESFGEDWLELVANKQQRGAWRARQNLDEGGPRSAKGISGLPEDEFSYSQFSDLLRIAENHWAPLGLIFPNQNETLVLMRRFKELRNPGLHGRPLYAHESHLLQGIAGQIRNQVTIFMSTRDAAGQYYPRIESVWDSLGFRYECGSRDAEYMGGVHETGTILRPGDHVTLSGSAVDPQARRLEWRVASNRGQLRQSVEADSEQVVAFDWAVAPDDVAEGNWITFSIRTVGTPYHREGDHDFRLTIQYCVRPPMA